MLRILSSFQFLNLLWYSCMAMSFPINTLGGNEELKKPDASPYHELSVTMDDYHFFLIEELKLLEEELVNLRSDNSSQTNNEYKSVEIQSIKKEIAHRKSTIANLEVNFLHFQEQLSDMISAQEQNLPDPTATALITTLKTGDLKAADILLSSVCDKGSDDIESIAKAYYQRGQISEEIGDFRLALKHYTQAVLISPNNAEFLKATGSLAETMGFISSAAGNVGSVLKS